MDKKIRLFNIDEYSKKKERLEKLKRALESLGLKYVEDKK